MRPVHALIVFTLGVLTAACRGDSGSDSGSGSGSSSDLRGGERLGWDQRVETADQLSGMRFRLWVDDRAQEMSNVSCGSLNADRVSSCTGVLPGMTGGPHTLAVAAIGADGSEGPRSATLQVTVVAAGTNGKLVFHQDLPTTAGTTGPAEAASLRPGDGVAAPHAAVDTTTLTEALNEPTDIAVAADGRVLVSERGGTVRVLVDGVLQSTPMLAMDDVSTDGGSGLLSLALAPDFVRSGFVYLGYTAGTGFRVARYRAVAGTLGERSIVFETLPERPYTAAVVRFGPDRRLYVALDDEGDAARGGDWGSSSGKVLRLNADGSVPADQAGFSPVYGADIRAPQAFDWSPTNQELWVAEGSAESPSLLTVMGLRAADRRRAGIVARYALPAGDVPSAALFYSGAAFTAWTGDLLLGLSVSGQLLRLSLDPTDATRVRTTEVVLDGTAGAIRALSIGADGSLYVAGDRTLLRLTPSVGL